jgi:signal transduction histidine kinase
MKTQEPVQIAQSLYQANNIIDRFIKSCSHELKSPLTSIEGLIMIADYYSNHHEVKHCMELIRCCVDDMKQIIHNLQECTLQLQGELKLEEIQAETLVRDVLSEYATELKQEQIEVSTEVYQPFAWRTDRQYNYLILKNLISNAIQFSDSTKSRKTISIKVSVKPDDVAIEVSDNGIGIPEVEKQKVFEPFHKSSTQSKGHGLGLFMVRSLVSRLKASISPDDQFSV